MLKKLRNILNVVELTTVGVVTPNNSSTMSVEGVLKSSEMAAFAGCGHRARGTLNDGRVHLATAQHTNLPRHSLRRIGEVCILAGVLNIGTNRGVLQDRMPSQHNEGLILWDARGTPLYYYGGRQHYEVSLSYFRRLNGRFNL